MVISPLVFLIPLVPRAPQKLLERVLVPRLRWRHHRAAQMTLRAVVRRLFPFHDELPFELRGAERDLQPRRGPDRESILCGQEHAALADVDDPDPQPSTEPNSCPPPIATRGVRRRSWNSPATYASTDMLPSAVPMYRTMASSTPGESFRNSTPIK